MKIHYLGGLLALGISTGMAGAKEQQMGSDTSSKQPSGSQATAGSSESPGIERPDSSTREMPNGTQGVTNTQSQSQTQAIPDRNIASVSFQSGQSDISANNAATLRSSINAAQQNGEIQKAVVAAWPDQLGTQNSNTNQVTQNLAQQRADAIERQLKDSGIQNVQTHVMTDSEPTWVESTFSAVPNPMGTDSTASTGTNATADQVRSILREEGGPGKAVVILQSEPAPTVAE